MLYYDCIKPNCYKTNKLKSARGTRPAVVLDGCWYPLTETCHVEEHLFLTVLFCILYAFSWRCRFPTRSLILVKYSCSTTRITDYSPSLPAPNFIPSPGSISAHLLSRDARSSLLVYQAGLPKSFLLLSADKFDLWPLEIKGYALTPLYTLPSTSFGLFAWPLFSTPLTRRWVGDLSQG